MHIRSIAISGFRSFGPEVRKVILAAGLTGIVGPNASGKTALLQALTKLFGISRAQRTIYRSDFHFPADTPPDDRSTRELFIDVVISLPELKNGKATADTVAPVFKHMQIKGPKSIPRCRLRLEAKWEDDGTADGEVTQELYWVHTLDDDIEDKDKHKVAATDRGLIQVYYTPAARDAGAQIRATTGALAARLLRAIEWSKKTREAVDAATKELSDAFGGEAAIAAISSALSDRWDELDDGSDADPRLALIAQRFDQVVAKIQVLFQFGAGNIERGIDVLSDGQQSLFYFALAAAVFDLERKAVTKSIEGFQADALRVPALSIFAIEEPENHLSPYYLSRIIRQVRSLIDTNSAQALVTSHSPAVLSRVEPEEVRYCRCDPKTRETTVRSVKLPDDDEEASKFVREAVLAFPELYFARFVLLVEGDSEQVVMPKLAAAKGILIDQSFVAIAPLGGRHVQHFWRLLGHIGIPYATLLDLDLGRTGGAWGRVKTTTEQLIANGAPKDKILAIENGVLSDERLAKMHTWDASDHKLLQGWVNDLQNYGVFFSQPLDFDMALLAAYPDAYEKVIPEGGGPKLDVETAAKAVLGNDGKGLTDYVGPAEAFKELMPAYRYHFMTHSKPATHLRAFAYLEPEQIAENMPRPYGKLLKHIRSKASWD